MTKWEIDKLIEENIAKFTDQNFWHKFKAPSKRVEDIQMQYSGVDVQLSNINFDEKAKIRGCLNSVYQYPSFELEMTTRSGVRREGWFFSALSTDFYSFVGVSADTTIENDLSADGHITAVDILWVKKSDVQKMVQEHVEIDQLKKDIAELQDEDCLDKQLGWNFSKARKRYADGKFWITYSKTLKEKPVNLVVPRATLEKLPHSRHFVVTKDRIKKL